MLPTMLCRSKLYISGFPEECLPKVVRDKVEGHCGPRSWSFPALQAMYQALKAGEVKIKRRPKGRRVLFHLLPTDTQLERGETHGTDTNLAFSKPWLDEHMVDDSNENSDNDMIIEPMDETMSYQRPALRPLRHESVWERFGKIKIDEDSSDTDNEKIPEPPWKKAMEEFTRPSSERSDHRSPSVERIHMDDSDDAHSYASDNDNEPVDEPVQYPINRLLPSHLPQAFQGKGRILLWPDDVFEWFPHDPYATDVPPTRMVWNADKMKWKLLPETRITFPLIRRASTGSEVPNRVGGQILGKGVCEHNTVRKVWECLFVGRAVFGNLHWSPDVAAWEWTLEDPDGRRKWLGRDSPDRVYPQIENGS